MSDASALHNYRCACSGELESGRYSDLDIRDAGQPINTIFHFAATSWCDPLNPFHLDIHEANTPSDGKERIQS